MFCDFLLHLGYKRHFIDIFLVLFRKLVYLGSVKYSHYPSIRGGARKMLESYIGKIYGPTNGSCQVRGNNHTNKQKAQSKQIGLFANHLSVEQFVKQEYSGRHCDYLIPAPGPNGSPSIYQMNS